MISNAFWKHYQRVTGRVISRQELNDRVEKNREILTRAKSSQASSITFGGWGTPMWKKNGYFWSVNFLPDDAKAKKRVAGDADAPWKQADVEVALATLN
jgi:hypothetical protein